MATKRRTYTCAQSVYDTVPYEFNGQYMYGPNECVSFVRRRRLFVVFGLRCCEHISGVHRYERSRRFDVIRTSAWLFICIWKTKNRQLHASGIAAENSIVGPRRTDSYITRTRIMTLAVVVFHQLTFSADYTKTTDFGQIQSGIIWTLKKKKMCIQSWPANVVYTIYDNV